MPSAPLHEKTVLGAAGGLQYSETALVVLVHFILRGPEEHMAIFLSEANVEKLATMNMALEAVEEAFRLQGEEKAGNAPRRRCRLQNGLLHVMSASVPTLGFAGLKCYTSSGGTDQFLVHLYNADDGQLLAIMEADRLGQLRTGAASAVATRFMAREDVSRLAIIGTGRQARAQLQAICAVRPIQTIAAYGRDSERREQFCKEMTKILGVTVTPAPGPEEAVRDADIVVTATTSSEPVFNGEWLAKGTHVNAIGSNSLARQEIDVETVRRSACVVVDSLEQARIENGDLARAVEAEAFYWEDARELGLVVIGDFPGREDDSEITLYESGGIALEDVALAGRIYKAAQKVGVGVPLPF
jgi:ornithine cyclodeaminase/alanine dehydrogenase-like protein (mu-crystallin family)